MSLVCRAVFCRHGLDCCWLVVPIIFRFFDEHRFVFVNTRLGSCSYHFDRSDQHWSGGAALFTGRISLPQA